MKFLEKANLPIKKTDYILVDERIGDELKKNISALGIKMFFTPSAKKLTSPIRSHADIVIHHLGGNKFICEPTLFEYFKSIFERENTELICGENILYNDYPNDCFYNVARIGNSVFSCFSDSSILDFDTANYARKINVKQGYAKCNICIVNENAIITSDDGIFKAARENGFDVLKIQNGFIDIDTYEYGFIGGASGLLSDDTMGFCGDITTHPDCEKILSFLKNYNIYPENLASGNLYDVGSILPVAYKE